MEVLSNTLQEKISWWRTWCIVGLSRGHQHSRTVTYVRKIERLCPHCGADRSSDEKKVPTIFEGYCLFLWAFPTDIRFTCMKCERCGYTWSKQYDFATPIRERRTKVRDDQPLHVPRR